MIKNRDLFGRIGGEEFGALIFAKNKDEYTKTADAIRYSVENISLSCEGKEIIPLRISIGLSVYRPGEDTLETLMHRSDIALYQAKNDGRNRVAVL
jgi:diguanylate cyclase (GGDEF)-like protein